MVACDMVSETCGKDSGLLFISSREPITGTN